MLHGTEQCTQGTIHVRNKRSYMPVTESFESGNWTVSDNLHDEHMKDSS